MASGKDRKKKDEGDLTSWHKVFQEAGTVPDFALKLC
jgi:hypothetical protein